MQDWLMKLMGSPGLIQKLKPETQKKLSEVAAQRAQAMAIKNPEFVKTTDDFKGGSGAGAAMGQGLQAEKKQQPDQKQVQEIQKQGLKDNPQLDNEKKQRNFAIALEKMKRA
jgi:hypothetical protein